MEDICRRGKTEIAARQCHTFSCSLVVWG
jgi:hypothetical protein